MQLKVINGGQHSCPGIVKTISLSPKTTFLDELILNLKTVYYSNDFDSKARVFGVIRVCSNKIKIQGTKYERQ